MKPKQNKYTTEIHIGLLVLIIIFLGLNFSSNWIIYNSRIVKHEQAYSDLHSKAVAVSRNYKNQINPELSADQIQRFKNDYYLTDLIVIPADPAKGINQNRREWFISIAHKFPPADLRKIAGKFLEGEFDDIARGEGKEYYYLYPFTYKQEKMLLIVSKSYPDLAYVDDASSKQLILSIITLFVVVVIYVLLYRFILAPFKTLREEAETAGRKISDETDEVSSLIEDYKKIISELRLKEKELLDYNEQITDKADSLEVYNRYLLRSINVGVMTLDMNGRIVETNRQLKDLCCHDADDITGKELSSLNIYSDEIVELIYDALEVETNIPYTETGINIHEGSTKFVGLTVSPIYDHKNIQIGVSILCTDITELNKLREELEQKKQLAMLGEMSAGLAHQLRNSLGAINGYNTLLKRRIEHKKDPGDAVLQMEKELTDSECLISKFLEYAKPYDFHPDRCNPSSFINETLNSLKNRNDFQDIVIEFKNELDLETFVEIDQLLLKHTVVNLVENAYKASRGYSDIVEVRTFIESGRWMLSIKDYGQGIGEQFLDKIFTPFYTTDPSGTGLGLPLVKKIIALHGGNIEVKSEINKGAQFIISIPLSSETFVTKTEFSSSGNL